MYEYSIETMEVPAKAFKQSPTPKELDRLLEMINKKSEEGWELVSNTFMASDGLVIVQSFVCTFKREKK